MKVIVSERAKKQLKKITRLKQMIIVSKLQTMAEEGEILNEDKLSGYTNIYKIRVGDYRIVCRRLSGEVHVVLVGHRKEVYKLLERLLG